MYVFLKGINPPQKICVKPEDVDEDSITPVGTLAR